MILTDKEEINSEIIDFIEHINKFSEPEKGCFIIFDKKDITLKIDIDEVKIGMPEQEFYSKVDAKINDKTILKDIIRMLKDIPQHLELRLEADNIEQIIELMKCEILIEKLKSQGIKFLHKDIEIEPRTIKSKIDEDDLKIEVKEIKAKRNRINRDYDI